MDALPVNPPALHAACMAQAADGYGVDPSVVSREYTLRGGRSAQVFRNPDGSYEIGIMRIPSQALAGLARYGVTADRLLKDDCLNIQIATYMIKLRPPETPVPADAAAAVVLRPLPLPGEAVAAKVPPPRAPVMTGSAGGDRRAACMARSAAAYKLPLVLLQAIAKTEGGTTGTVSRNKNGSVDMGVMQVNSIHLQSAPHRFLARGVTAQQLINDDCINIAAGASILRYEIDRAPDFWTGVARYHSRTPQFASIYLAKVVQHLRVLTQTMGVASR